MDRQDAVVDIRWAFWLKLIRRQDLESQKGDHMSRLLFSLHRDGRHCSRCNRRCNLFGSRDVETGWEGWCSVCNSEWKMHNILSRCLCSSRACSIASSLPGMGMHFPIHVVITVYSFLFVDSATKHRAVMRRHKRNVQLLEWFCVRLDLWLANDSSEELAMDDPVEL